MSTIIQNFDLSTISLPAGTPTITATALADGIAESERSNEIKYSTEYLKYNLYGVGAWEITGITDQYKGISTVIIPSEINGLPVEKIAPNAFANDTSIQRVHIPPTIQTIGAGAFDGCSKLTDVIFEEDTHYTIYFRNYKNWTNVCCSERRNHGFPYGEVGREMTYVETEGKFDIYSIRVEKTDPDFVATTLEYIKFNGLNNSTGEREYTQEIKEERIDDCACWFMPYGSVGIHNSYVTKALIMGNYAFANTAIESIVLPNKLGIIADQMFYGCKSLKSVTIPSTTRVIGNEAFYECSALTGITIPLYATTIGRAAFYRAGLTNLIIPAWVTVMGERMCNFCESLTSVTINSNSGTIPAYAFDSCSKLQEVIYGPTARITSIGDFAFNGVNLSQITIPESVIWIGYQAFQGAKAAHAIFEHPQGWFYTENDEPSGGTDWIADRDDASSVLADWLTHHVYYKDMRWYRILQLPAPEISIAEGSILTIIDYSGLAEFFKIYINDETVCRATIEAKPVESEEE